MPESVGLAVKRAVAGSYKCVYEGFGGLSEGRVEKADVLEMKEGTLGILVFKKEGLAKEDKENSSIQKRWKSQKG